jgi:hypothetical protein
VYAKNIFVCRGTLILRAGRDSVREWSQNLFHAKGGLRVRWVDQNYQADEPEPWTPNGSNSLGKCPLEDPAAGDFRLRPASPATELEIPQLPTRVLELARRALGETAVNDV